MLSLILISAGITAAHVAPLPPFHRRQGTGIPDPPDWSTIEPSYDLEYTSCFDGALKCARLLVPLDWSKHSLNSTCGGSNGSGDYSVAISIATFPATVPDTDPSFGGTVLYNPGGPGGASTDMPWLWGPTTQQFVDGDKHFEVMMFDPRGVGQSTPAASCFEAAWQERLYNFQKQTAGHIGSGPDTFAVHYEYERAHGELCSTHGQGDINAHIGTASVARDMLHMVDKADEERRRRNELPPRSRDEELPKSQYVGFSYGSVLGNYFASMFPGRVGRMVVAGVFDADAYRAGHWNTSMVDTEAAIDSAYEACWDRSCPLRLESDSGPSDIRARIDAAIADLDANSASVIIDGQIHVLRSETLRSTVLNLAYLPMDPFDLRVNQITAILEGDYTDAVTKIVPEYLNTSDSTRTISIAEVGAIIRCLDLQKPERPLDLVWAREVYASMEAHSPIAAPAWALMSLRCTGFTLEPAYDFSDAFGSPAPDASSPDAPDAPLLLVSSRIDPVTPLPGALAMTRQHANSSVVIAELSGHDPFWPSSECLLNATRAYFAHGFVPPNGTVCVPEPVETVEEDMEPMGMGF